MYQPPEPSVLAPTDTPALTTVGFLGTPSNDIPVCSTSIFDMSDAWILRDSFTIDASMDHTTVVKALDILNMYTPLVMPPQACMLNVMQSSDYAVEIALVFVKIPSARVTLDAFMSKAANWHETTTTSANFINHEAFTVDDNTVKIFRLDAPLNGICPLVNVPNAGPLLEVAMPWWANAQLTLKIRQPYIPSNLHPDSMDVIVFWRPIVSSFDSFVIDPLRRHLILQDIAFP